MEFRAQDPTRGVGRDLLVLAGIVVALSMAVAVPASAAPFAPQATLTASDEIGHAGLGSAVALSHDGSTALLGGPEDNGGAGAAWVFVRRGSKWTEQVKLTGAGEIGSGEFGTSVALSADGKTALIGAPGDDSGLGAAWVFVRRGSTWKQTGSKLVGKDPAGQGEAHCDRYEGYEFCFVGHPADFGASVALSSDGNTALIGGPGDNKDDGAAWVFTRTGTTWTQQGEKLTGGGEENIAIGHGCQPYPTCDFQEGGQFGASVALSSDGNTALIGGPGDETYEHFGPRPTGAVWTFTRSRSDWTQQGEKLRAHAGELSCCFGLRFGESVALSSDSSTALIGGPNASNGIGRAWSFARSGSTWTQQGEALAVGEREDNGEEFGISLGLSSDGNAALIGYRGGERRLPTGGWVFTPPGVWVFTRSGSTWVKQFPPMYCAPEGAFRKRGEGCDVALSGDGTTVLVGTAVYVDAPGLPSITSVTPNRSPQRSDVLVTVTGSGFTKATAVMFGSMRATSFTVNSDSSITAVSPAEAAGTVDVTVTNREGTSGTWEGDRFSYVLPSAVDPPTVATGQASPVTRAAETLNATVNPNGAEVSDCHFEYGTTTSYGSAAPCTSLPRASTPVARIAAGPYHTLAVTPSGRLYAFGFNDQGQLGFESASESTPKPTPVPLPGATGPVTQVAAGAWHSLAITSTGQLYAFGENYRGQLGSETRNATLARVTLPGATGPVTQIAAGESHSLALTSTGQLYAFGDNYYGQLGNTTNVETESSNPTPTLVTLPEATGPIAQIAAGGNDSFALTSTGQLYAFGANDSGQLGSPSTALYPNPTPTLVTLPGASGPVTQISTGGSHTLAVTSTGQLYAFGYNPFGQLGNTTNINTSNSNPTPTLVTLPGSSGPVTEGSAGGSHSLAITSTGQLYAFGYNYFGQLGDTTNINTVNANPTPSLVTLPGASGPVTQVAAGESDSLALSSTGQLYAFGKNSEGELGIDANFGTDNPNPTPTLVAFPGESPLPASGSLAGLKANTTYHFRVVATNAGGTSYGADETFTTLP